MKWFFSLLALCLLAACNNGGDSASPYAALLEQPPYTAITDSIKKEPRRDELYFRRAILLNGNGLPEPALADFRRAWELNPQEPYASGVSNLLLESKPDSAVAFLKNATNTLPESIFLHIMLAKAYRQTGKADDALAVYNRILEMDSTEVNTLFLKAELLEEKNDIAGAITNLEQAHRLLPSNKKIVEKLIYQYAESKNPKALVLADEQIKNDSLKMDAGPLYIKGLYYSNINETVKAIDFFDKTIQQDHHYLNAYIEKGKILFNKKQLAEALKTFQLANTVKPSFPDAWYWIGRCQEAMGQKEDAKLNYEKAYGLDKTFVEAKEAAEKL